MHQASLVQMTLLHREEQPHTMLAYCQGSQMASKALVATLR